MNIRGPVLSALAAGWCAAAALAAAAPKPASPPGAGAKTVKAAPAPAAHQPAAAVSPEDAEFFEKQVRPVLAEQCYSCHGPKVQQAGVRLDSRALMLKGTDAGKKVLVPGEPEKSSLVQVIRHDGPVKMPPQGKLPEAAIAALTEWVKRGAPWPGPDPAQQARAADPDAWKKHWAFQPVRRPAVPAVDAARSGAARGWAKTPVDAFILAKLRQKGMIPAAPADRRTLIRRATFDLHGLPPTAEETDAFLADQSPDAFAKVVDRLLASPRYGERWGRYWLDIARYADTKGYVFQEERRYPFAYTYRDYVISAFNQDLPYDQFLIHQIAADKIPLGEDRLPLAAMGFLTVGRRFLNNVHDIIDDRIDVLMRGTQAMTVACARCHDHKFDPIPTADYYSLYGVFAASMEPRDPPILSEPERTEAYAAYEKQLKALEADVDRYLASRKEEVLARARGKIAEALMAVRELSQGGETRAVASKYDIPSGLLDRWRTFLGGTAKGHHALFAPWHAFAAIPDAEFKARAPELAARFAANADPQRLLHARVAQLFAGKAPESLREVADRYAALLREPGDDQQLRHALDSIGGPLNIEGEQLELLFNRKERDELRALKRKVDALKATSPAAPPRAMVLVDAPKIDNPRIFRRGNPNNPGEEVPRRFLLALAGPNRQPFRDGSGRLELARAIASRDNPLTARVLVNRVWLHHFGAGLVRTPSDFGLRSDPPSHPELLDYLASRFMDEGWSLKKLHRLLMLSAVYQQGSDANPRYARLDPENTLLWRYNRRRLDFEAMRDSLLAASGKLDLAEGGPAVDITKAPFTGRRTVYGFIDRQNLPGLFRTFDFASPDTTSPQRYTTTVPQQALFMLNSPFVVEQAKHLVGRVRTVAQEDPEAAVREMYRIVYARAPSSDEVTLGLRFLKSAQPGGAAGTPAEPPVWQYGYGDVSDGAGRLSSFHPLAHFTGYAWQGGAQLPDPKLGWVLLNAQGGHPGNDLRHASVRRWTAPQDAVISITGVLVHDQDQGDGVRARIHSSRAGVLGTWTVKKSRAETPVREVEVKRGDTIDFVVDCREGPAFDSYLWAPVIRLADGRSAGQRPADTAPKAGVWQASADFRGPAPVNTGSLSPWEKYAQVLLLSNEFMFVD